MPTFQVIVVDDFQPWRRFSCSVLNNHSDSWIVSEACDGPEAIQKANELQPDLILLDIGLPHLNGIEVARQVRANCPHTKILFVSEQRSRDIVEAALAAGGHGYVLKSDGHTDLSKGVDAVFRGTVYVSRTLARQGTVAPEAHATVR